MAHGQALRVLAGVESQQQDNRRKGDQLADQGQRQPGGGGAANGGQRTTPLRQRLGGIPPAEEDSPGSAQGITATAHKLARIIYSMLWYGQKYVDAGAEYYESQYRQRALRNARRRAEQLGYELVPKFDDQDRPSSGLHLPAVAAG